MIVKLDSFIHDEVLPNGYTADYKKIHAWGYIKENPLEMATFVEFSTDKWGIQSHYKTKLEKSELPLPDEKAREIFELDIAEFVLTHPELSNEKAYE